MSDLASWLLSSQGYMPHGHCYLWQPGTLWLNAGSDALIAAAYFAIPVSLYSLVRRRVADMPFPGIFLMFAAFILLCGSTHLMEIWTIWNPDYRLAGALKLVTGTVSLATTIALLRLMPTALQLRSPRELQREVEARTAELAAANELLRRNVEELQRQREEIQVTHRRRNESLALLATTLRSVGDAVISTNASGIIQFMNSAAEALTGWSEKDAQQRPVGEVFRIVNEQTLEPVESPVTKVFRDGRSSGLANHTLLLARDGTQRPIEDSGAPILEGGELKGAVLVFRDASLQRAHERALAASEKRFRAAVDAVRGVLWTNTADGQMRGEQPGWAALTGQSYEEYQGFGWSRAVHPQDAEATIEAWLAAVRERRLFVFEHRVRRHDGRWRIFSIRSIPVMDGDGDVVEWVGVHTDITEQREGELALREADRRKDVFLAVLSHELRNPLAPIRNAASLLERADLHPDVVHRSHLIIRRQVQHMAALLDDLLDMSRITRGVFTLKKRSVGLRALLSEAVESARPQIDRKGHTLRTEWPHEAVNVEVDPVRVVQIISNLLTNAAKYTDPGGDIVFKVSIDDATLIISVRDTGIGIAPEMLDRLFEMFSQINPHQGRAEGGLGIGLALVKGLVDLHGGRIEARSDGIERGSEFIVSMPCVYGPAESLPAMNDPKPPADRRASSREVLVADDNHDGAESLATLLRLAGYEVVVAHTGPDALAAAVERRPQVAILDIGMPGMSGYEVARRIRRETWGEGMGLIAVTGWGQEDDRRQAQMAGFDRHLTKPVDMAELEKLLESMTTEPETSGRLP